MESRQNATDGKSSRQQAFRRKRGLLLSVLLITRMGVTMYE